MELSELKLFVEDQKEKMKAKSGHLVKWSETGPVGISTIDALVSTIEMLQNRLEKLENNSR